MFPKPDSDKSSILFLIEFILINNDSIQILYS